MGGRALARSRPMSEGQVRAITFGSLWGTWQGWGLLEVMDWGERENCFLDVCVLEGPDGDDILRAMVVGGLAGVATGAVLARKPIASGVATTENFGALWGTWFGFAGGLVADLEGDQLLVSTLLMGDAGLLTTARLAPGWNMSRNRARMISISGVIGLLGGFGLDMIFQPDDQKVAMGIPLATSIAGLAIGARVTSDRPTRGGTLGSTFVTKRTSSAARRSRSLVGRPTARHVRSWSTRCRPRSTIAGRSSTISRRSNRCACSSGT